MTVERRIARLEAFADPSGTRLAHLTYDELEMQLLDVSRDISAAVGVSPDERAAASARVAEIEAGIRAQAEMRRSPGYEKHLAWVSKGKPDYVPAVCGWNGQASSLVEYEDLGRAGIMKRRAAILARPDVQALVSSPAMAT